MKRIKMVFVSILLVVAFLVGCAPGQKIYNDPKNTDTSRQIGTLAFTESRSMTSSVPMEKGRIPPMTKREKVVVSAYTQVLLCDFGDLHEYIEELMGRPVFTHEIPMLAEEIKRRSKKEFMEICGEVEV